MGRAVAATCMALLLAAPQAAAAPELLTSFSPQAVSAALRAAGATDVAVEQPSPMDDGTHLVTATDGSGRAINLVLRACDKAKPDRCLGLYMVYRWTLGDGGVSAGSLNAFNARYAFAKAHVDGDGGLVLDRYVIADGGVAPANLAENIAIFMRMPDRLLTDIDVTPGLKPDRTPMT